MITITSESKEKTECFCKVESLCINGIEKSVHDINPRGYFLSWDNGKKLTTLFPGVPQGIEIASGWGREVSLNFSSQEFDTGHFHFSLGF